MAKTAKKKTPWERPNPRKRAGKASRHLTPAKKAAAKASAKRAGRPYPNLVDNMRAAKAANRKPAKKSAAKAAKKTAGKPRTSTRKAAPKKQQGTRQRRTRAAS